MGMIIQATLGLEYFIDLQEGPLQRSFSCRLKCFIVFNLKSTPIHKVVTH